MNNQIINALIKDFSDTFELTTSLDEATLFEHFANYIVSSVNYNDTITKDSLEWMHLWKNALEWIDGWVIMINGEIIINNDELLEKIDIAKKTKNLEVKFIFIQSKTSESFSGTDILGFGDAVTSIFKGSFSWCNVNENIREFLQIKETIYNHAHLCRRNPDCLLYFIWTWSGNNDSGIQKKMQTIEDNLKKLSLFDEVKWCIWWAREITDSYRKIQETTEATVSISRKVTVPNSEWVSEAYMGYITFFEYKKIICQDNGELTKSIFYDNIRDFQWETDANKWIAQTLQSKEFDKFPLLNNGVTIICDEIKATWDNLTLKGYQIVNWCQTSHVLYANRDLDWINDMLIPVKIIASEDERLRDKIILSSNSQTAISNEQLQALTSFQKDLEQFYKTEGSEEERLYYERRAKQYDTDPTIPRTRIISIKSQIKSLASVFFDKPHRAWGYFASIYQELWEKEIFQSSHKLRPYYTSALLLYKIERAFGNWQIDPKYKKAKYHLLMIIKYLTTGPQRIQLNSNKVDLDCKHMEEKIKVNLSEILKVSIQILDSIWPPTGTDEFDSVKNFFKSSNSTEQIIKQLKEHKSVFLRV